MPVRPEAARMPPFASYGFPDRLLQIEAVEVEGALTGKDKEESFLFGGACPFQAGGKAHYLSSGRPNAIRGR